MKPTAGTSPFREAFRLAWPVTLSLLLHAGYRVNDQYWIRDLGAEAQAALGVTTFMLILNFAFITVVSTGTLARVARYSGAGRTGRVRIVYRSACKSGLVWLLLIGAAGWLTTPFWVRLCGAEGAVAVLGRDYLGTIYLGLPLLASKPIIDSVYIGLGNTVVPMALAALAVGLNFALNPALIYGWWGFPELGIAGAAWSTCISRGVAAVVGMVLLRRWYGLGRRWKRPVSRRETARIFRIGAPVALSTFAYAFVFVLVLNTSVSPLGLNVQAGLGVAFNGVEAVSYCGLMGPAMAAASIVGRRLGARDPEGARAGLHACLWMSCGFAAIASILFLAAAPQLAGAYTADARVLAEAVLYLQVVAWSQVVTAADSVLQQAMAGAGRTLGMSMWNTVGYLVRIPMAWAMAFPLGWGARGVWWALNLSNFLKLGAIFLHYRRLRLFGPPR